MTFQEFIGAAEMDVGYYVACEGEPLWKARLFAYRNQVHFALASIWCWATDHDWQDDSVAGPESGSMAASCKRCGYSFHHTLY